MLSCLEARAEAGQEEDDFWAEMFEEELDQVPVVGPEEMEKDLFGGDQPEEGRAPRRRPMPHSPTAAEMEEHKCTHLPHRPWCIFCRKARGRSDCHRQKTQARIQEDKNNVVSTFSFKYSQFGSNL